MSEDWSADVLKYAPDADRGVISAIVRYCGIALQNRDSSLVAFTQKDELNLVRENYLKKKLGLTAPDPELDSAIAAVGERMKADRTRNRVTVYYLLAEHFRKLSVFGGVTAAPAAAMAAERPAVVPPAPQAFSAQPAAAAAAAPSLMRWVPWLLLAAALLFLLWWLFANRTPAPVAERAPATVAAPAVNAPAVAGLPANVYFALDSAAVDAEANRAIGEAVAAVTNAGGKVAITAYTDRSGDLAHNEELAKNRAVAVRDALVKAGIPVGGIEMRPPAYVETGAVGTTDADARRVVISQL